MNDKKNKTNKEGAALLVVLFVVMAITILSLGFLSRSDVELACGENMILRTQMDYLAESGLEHARGLILNPQDVDSEYWAGDVRQQLVEGSDDYCDVTVSRDDPNLCNYIIICDAYREKNGEKTGRSRLEAELRLDPCIAFWTGSQWTTEPLTTINGDVYCDGDLRKYGDGADINGDAFAKGDISATNIEGQKSEYVVEAPVDLPGLATADFSSQYYIGSDLYSVDIISTSDLNDITLGPTAGNPAGIYYRDGGLELPGGVNIEGMLVVNGDLRITGANNVISAMKNFPALLVSGKVVMEDGGTLEVKGLAQIGQGILVTGGNVDIDVVGSLFIVQGNIDGAYENSTFINVTAEPSIASIQIWPTAGTARRWSPAAGAFFRSIRRN